MLRKRLKIAQGVEGSGCVCRRTGQNTDKQQVYRLKFETRTHLIPCRTVGLSSIIFKRTVRMGIRLSKTDNPLHSVHIIILYCITGNPY